MPLPTLANFEDVTRLRRLQEENESLKARLVQLIDQSRNTQSSSTEVTPIDVPPPVHIYDDFYVIAQENNTAENQVKTLKSLIKNIGTSSSPTMSRKDLSSKKKVTTNKSWK